MPDGVRNQIVSIAKTDKANRAIKIIQQQIGWRTCLESV